MEDDDDDILQKNMLDRYLDRNKKIDICLAEFVAFYDGIGKGRRWKKKTKEEFAAEDDTEDKDDDQEFTVSNCYVLKDGIKRRVKPRIIRYVNFKAENDSEEHYRELLYLYLFILLKIPPN